VRDDVVIEPRQLAAFIAVSEELSFARAGNRVGAGAPSVSRLIARLEASLGFALFERSSRKVVMTSAGAALLPVAREAADAHQRLLDRAVAVRDGIASVVRLGTTGGASAPLELLLAEHQRIRPQVELRLVEAPTPRKMQMLLDGELDVAFVRAPVAAHGIEIADLWREPLYVVMAAGHPVAGNGEVHLSQLESDSAMIPPASVNPGVHRSALGHARRAGFIPIEAPWQSDFGNALATIAATRTWMLLTRSNALAAASDRIAARPVLDPEATVAVSLAWRARGLAKPARAIVELALELSRREAWGDVLLR
jgi:DNA-binding transcriptional LysR family regulator